MNRAQKRALARIFGRAKATRDEERLTALEQENHRLRQAVADLEYKHDLVPGVVEGRKDWFVLVGGEEVELKAMPPVEWMRTLEHLPGFLFAFALERVERPSEMISDETTTEITDLAKRWLMACAVRPGEMHLERLTFPEAQHAVAHIAELNGVAAYMRAWFRRRLTGVAGDSSGGEDVRRETERPPRNQPN